MRLRPRDRSPQLPLLVSLLLLCGLCLFQYVQHGSYLHSHSDLGDAPGALRDPAALKRLYQLAMKSKNEEDFSAMVASLQQEQQLNDDDHSDGSVGASIVSTSSSEGGGGAAASGSQGGRRKVKIPRLSKALAMQYAKNNIIIVTWANFHFADFVVNWVKHVRSHGITNYLVGAMDVETAQLLAGAGVQVFAMYNEGANSTGLGAGDMGWGSKTFYKMGRQKVDLARTFSEYGLDLCLCDVDTVWINDPTQYFERFPEAHILASSDSLNPSIALGDDGLERPDAIHSAMNIGLLFFRHSKNTTRFVQTWAARLEADEKVWDQNAFNWIGHEGLMPFKHLPANDRLVWAANQSVVVGILPIASFASGHTFFVQRLFEYQQVKPYVVHTTFQYGGTKGKRHRLREAMLWIDPPAYYAEGRFLSFDLRYPKVATDYQNQEETMMGGRFKTSWTNKRMQEAHLAAMHDQLAQLQAALALAVALNRTIIMPKLLCLCDRYWGPVEFCQVPGAFKTRLPFVCPMDHILEPFNFDDPGHGPPIAFREYSFLSNPRTPKRLLAERLVVTPTAGVTAPQERQGGGSAGAGDGASAGGEGSSRQLLIPPQQSETQLRKIFSAYQSAPLLHFTTVEAAFGRWEDASLGSGLKQRFHHMLGFWCCKTKEREDEDAGVPYVKLVQDVS